MPPSLANRVLALALPKPGVAPIAGIGTHWEQIQEVRQLLLSTGSIFKGAKPQQAPIPNVAGAALNVETLKPLLSRLADDNGNVLMVTIPDLEVENLD